MFYTPVSSLSHSFSTRTSFRHFTTFPLSIPLLHYPDFLKAFLNFPSCCNLNPLLPVLSTMDTKSYSSSQYFSASAIQILSSFALERSCCPFLDTDSLGSSCTKLDTVLLRTSITKWIIQEIFLF